MYVIPRVNSIRWCSILFETQTVYCSLPLQCSAEIVDIIIDPVYTNEYNENCVCCVNLDFSDYVESLLRAMHELDMRARRLLLHTNGMTTTTMRIVQNCDDYYAFCGVLKILWFYWYSERKMRCHRILKESYWFVQTRTVTQKTELTIRE